MTLYHKAVLLTGLTISALALASFVVARTVLMPALLAHEQHNIRQRMETANTAMDSAVAELERTASDYATWDRTYEFVAHPNADYARVDIPDQSFAKYDIPLVMVIGLDDALLLQKTVKLSGRNISDQDIAAIRAASRPALATVRNEVGVRGIVAAPSAPYLVSARPIVTSAGLGPVRGMLVMARPIDGNELAYIGQLVHGPVAILDQAESARIRRDSNTAELSLPTTRGWFTRRPAEIVACVLLLDLDGRPAASLAITTDRNVYDRSRRVIWLGALLVASIGIVLGLGKLWFLHALVFARLRVAARAVGRITAGKDLSIRIPVTREDELDLLTRALNLMLDELERSRNELIQLHAAARFDAEHDALTTLKNRRAILAALQIELARATREHTSAAVLLADIDHFKRINDRFGHRVGDVVLGAVAAAIESQLRPYDAAGRYGGEEFLIIVPGVNHVRAMHVAERLRARVEQVVRVMGNIDHPVTISIGVAVTNGLESSEALIEAADVALYRAKSEGRNRVEMAAPRAAQPEEEYSSV
jgi:diguanylate cyclase (GGDEF)-like protein